MRPFCVTGPADAVDEATANAVTATNRPSLNPCIEPGLRDERFDPSSGGRISAGQRTSEPKRLRLIRAGRPDEALAAASEVAVSSTVHDLVVGSGLRFTDHGVHELKGVPGAWHLYR